MDNTKQYCHRLLPIYVTSGMSTIHHECFGNLNDSGECCCANRFIAHRHSRLLFKGNLPRFMIVLAHSQFCNSSTRAITSIMKGLAEIGMPIFPAIYFNSSFKMEQVSCRGEEHTSCKNILYVCMHEYIQLTFCKHWKHPLLVQEHTKNSHTHFVTQDA